MNVSNAIASARHDLLRISEESKKAWEELFAVLDLAQCQTEPVRDDLLAYACSLEAQLLGRCDLLGEIVDGLIDEDDDETAADRGRAAWEETLQKNAAI